VFTDKESGDIVETVVRQEDGTICHYFGEDDGSLEVLPCTCGAQYGEECICNSGLIHVEVHKDGTTHVWPYEHFMKNRSYLREDEMPQVEF